MRVEADMEGEYICCFTGHRNIPSEHIGGLSGTLDRAIDKLVNAGVSTFRAGGAIGFDTFAALKVIEKKSSCEGLRLELYLPCKDQSKKWNEYNKRAYEYVLKHADKIIYTSESYTSGCMLLRDRRMVEGSDFCIAYCTRSSGGTAYTLDYAKKQGLRVLNLAMMIKDTKGVHI